MLLGLSRLSRLLHLVVVPQLHGDTGRRVTVRSGVDKIEATLAKYRNHYVRQSSHNHCKCTGKSVKTVTRGFVLSYEDCHVKTWSRLCTSVAFRQARISEEAMQPCSNRGNQWLHRAWFKWTALQGQDNYWRKHELLIVGRDTAMTGQSKDGPVRVSTSRYDCVSPDLCPSGESCGRFSV